MQSISIHNFNIPAPSSIAELSKKQCRILSGAIFHNLEVPRLRLLLFMDFLKSEMVFREKTWALWHLILKPYFVEKTMLGYFIFEYLGVDITIQTLSDSSMITLSEWHTDWLFEGTDIISQQKFDKLAGFCGPANSLNNICFRQFRMAEEFSYLYGQTKNEVHLNTLLAWLYLPKKILKLDITDKAYRAALSPMEVKRRADKIGKIDIETRYYLYLWYNNTRATIQNKFDSVWSGGDEPRIKTQTPLERLRQNFSGMLVLRAEHVTKMEDTDFSPLFDVLQFFQTEVMQAKAK